MKVHELSKGVERVLENVDSQGNAIAADLDGSSSNMTNEDIPIEATLLKLAKFVNLKIRHEDFSIADKKNMLELFVSHATTMTYMFNAIFQ